MKVSAAGVMVVVIASCLCAAGQHGIADQGFNKYGFRGDTWTGIVTTVDHDKSLITLQYEHKGKVENFTGALKPPLTIVDADGNPAKPPIQIKAGDRLRVYYYKEGSKYIFEEGGKRHEEIAASNLIFQVNFLPSKK